MNLIIKKIFARLGNYDKAFFGLIVSGLRRRRVQPMEINTLGERSRFFRIRPGHWADLGFRKGSPGFSFWGFKPDAFYNEPV